MRLLDLREPPERTDDGSQRDQGTSRVPSKNSVIRKPWTRGSLNVKKPADFREQTNRCHTHKASAAKMRQRIRVRYTATMDPITMARLEIERGPLNRSAMVEVAVGAWFEFLDRMKKMKERYDNASKTGRSTSGQ